jgi:type IX secretion system PorP/SprF family membrane protein
MSNGLTIPALVCAFMLFAAGAASGQPQWQFTQVTKSMELQNPSYNASKTGPNALILHRNQWTGIDGAPQSGAINVHLPFNNAKLGAGATGSAEFLGLRRDINGALAANSQVRLGSIGYLAAGLSAGIQSVTYDEQKARPYTQHGYEGVSSYNYNSPIIGSGLYFFNLRSQIGFACWYTGGNSRKYGSFAERLGFVANITGTINISEMWSAKPYLIARYSNAYAYAAEAGSMFLFKHWLWVGGGYRYNSAASAMADFYLSKFARLGYSYDFPVGTTKGYGIGGHEIRLSIEIKKETATEQLRFR